MLGQAVTLPGIDPTVAHVALEKQTYLQFLGVAVGGQLSVPTLFSLGLGPYMTGLIVWQAVTSLDLESVNRMSINQAGYIQKFITLIIAFLQGYPVLQYVQPALEPIYIGNTQVPTSIISFGAVLVLVAGAMFTVFLGNLNNDKGLGGISMMILPGVLMGLPKTLQVGWGSFDYKLTAINLIIAGIVMILVIIILVMLLQIELRIPLQKPLMEGSGSKSYLPFKLLIAVAMPFMFSSTLFMLPRNLVQGNYDFSQTGLGKFILLMTNQQTGLGIVNYGIIIMLLTYAFGFITVQPLRLTKQMKENNEYIFGVFSGSDNSKYLLDRFFTMATFGGLCFVIMAVIPLIIGLKYPGIANYTLYIGSVAILVTLIQVLWDQIRALYSKNHYRIF
ncbi:preprotein translocase subunit SecY [Fructilactobacillus lindneri DSM 20690 = JCM 11027]|uniref:Preprotein translocase subunit SecY n=1 Tax=Fructilactobacillus lindneri DSM 20690 = JCM 11027 TaxID=1122148 RepID=A0A0R2JW36_9LACO|nr:preprotein translocase subunit SecY [Fructilactobacillus lindneri DSM 20690 = JCM 11027]